MDEIEISIERGSEPPRRPSSEMPQINPRIAVGAAGLFILGLVMWLGAQTPARTTPTSVPATTTTTEVFASTTEAQFAVPGPVLSEREPEPELDQMQQWLAALEANPSESLSLLENPLFIFVANFEGGGTLLELAPGAATPRTLYCEGDPIERIMGQLPGKLIFTTGEAVCIVALDELEVTALIPNRERFDIFVPSGKESGWFCDGLTNGTAAVVRFEIGAEPSDQFVVSSCPVSADGDELLLYSEDGEQPYLWSVGDVSDVPDTSESDDCLLVGLSERFRLCHVGEHVEFRSHFSDVNFKIPANPNPDIFWFAVVSPDETRVLLVPYGESSDLMDSELVVFDLNTQELIYLDREFRQSNGIWLSNGELILQPFGGFRSSCEGCSRGLVWLNIDTGESAQLIDLAVDLANAYIQVLGT